MKAMILAAGFGSRLREITKVTPKPLVLIDDKPILRLVAENLYAAGVSEIVINLHYLADQVRDYCEANLKDLFSKIHYSKETEILGTGGGLKAAKAFLENEKFFYLVNADIYSNFDLNILMSEVKGQSEVLAALAVMDRSESTYLEFDSSNSFKGWAKAEQQPKTGLERKAFCGLHILSSKIFHYLDQHSEQSFSIIDTYCKAAQAQEKLISVDLGSSVWFDMGTLDKLQELREYFNSK
jgi:MurNAc alpha-1-phosphate uridylyltransferase